MTEDQVRQLADGYARSHNLQVAGIRNVVRVRPDFLFGKDKVRGGDVWQVSFNNVDEDEVISSRRVFLHVDDITGEVSRDT